ncbi:MAG: phosphoribosylformylglycinamidine cyclo-ligase [Prochlorococcus sp. SP3034]|nr:phosphoribosylformylglycinamidine cyclo-ligase [Prochlorococcus sp. SP3034]|tara:strand:- start:1310 stop:2353 length:1044 start_codon:yes stop_codon:yes gene_type:complete
MDYKKSGVDIQEGRRFVNDIKQTIENTHTSNVINGLGGFGGLFRLPIKDFKSPVLVSGTDGVGTKLELAQNLNFHSEVGIDLVAMCINDIITCGAQPLFFLDYIATGKLDKEQLQDVIKGIAKSCKENNCSLLGGETAEMPGFYSKNKYDLAGFCVGIVEEEDLITGSKISEDDVIIALKSNGIHSNGFSLVREIIRMNPDIEKEFQDLTQLDFYQELLKPTLIYFNLINELLISEVEIKGMAHITGGGIPENLPRCMGSEFIPYIDTKSWEIPHIFKFLKEMGQVPTVDLWNTFNLGVGFCLVIDKKYKNIIFQKSSSHNIKSWEIGKILRRNDSNVNQVLAGVSM